MFGAFFIFGCNLNLYNMKKLTIFIQLLTFSQFVNSQTTCEGINTRIDKFEKTTTYFSNPNRNLSISKKISTTDTTFTLYLNISRPTLSNEEKGLKLLLEDGTILDYPNQTISVSVNSAGTRWEYSTAFDIDNSFIELLKKHTITDIKIGMFDKEILLEFYTEFLENLNCITK